MHHHHPTKTDEIVGGLIITQGIRDDLRASRAATSAHSQGGFPWGGLIISFIVGCFLLGPLMIIVTPVVLVLLLLAAIF